MVSRCLRTLVVCFPYSRAVGLLLNFWPFGRVVGADWIYGYSGSSSVGVSREPDGNPPQVFLF